jgi:hypothetical protein
MGYSAQCQHARADVHKSTVVSRRKQLAIISAKVQTPSETHGSHESTNDTAVRYTNMLEGFGHVNAARPFELCTRHLPRHPKRLWTRDILALQHV